MSSSARSGLISVRARYDVRPRYVLYGGLLFQPLSLDLIDAYQPTDLRFRHFFDYFVPNKFSCEHPEVVVLTNILPGPDQHLSGAVSRRHCRRREREENQNARMIWPGLRGDTADRFVIHMIGDGPPLVLDPKEVEAARDRIKSALQRRPRAKSDRTAGGRPPADEKKNDAPFSLASHLFSLLALCQRKRRAQATKPAGITAAPVGQTEGAVARCG